MRRHVHDEGASAVETALVLPILIMLVFGIIEFGILFNRMQGMHAATREGARLGALVDVTVADIETRAAAAAPPFVDLSDLDVNVERIQVEHDGDETVTAMANGTDAPCDITVQPTGGTDPDDIATVHVRVETSLLNPGKYGVIIPLVTTFAYSHPSEAEFICEYE